MGDGYVYKCGETEMGVAGTPPPLLGMGLPRLQTEHMSVVPLDGGGSHSQLGAYMWKFFGAGPNDPSGPFFCLPSRTCSAGSHRHFWLGTLSQNDFWAYFLIRNPFSK